MSNIKLSGHNWATDGIYDTAQAKTQKTINAELYSLAGGGSGSSGGLNCIGLCSTAAGTNPKVVSGGTVDSFRAVWGASCYVVFQNAVNASSTMNVNGTGSFPIRCEITSAITADVIKAGDLVGFVFDGEAYYVVSNSRWGPEINNRAPASHASSATTYGTGTGTNYGHLKLSASTSSTSGVSGGIAATPSAVKAAYDLANGKPSLGSSAGAANGTASAGSATTAARSDHVHPTDTSRAPTSHASTATTYGIGTNANYGHVKLSDSTSTTSGQTAGIAATPTAVKAAYDLANTANTTASTANSGLSNKQDKNIYVTSKSVAASAWASNTTYSAAGFTYRAAIAISGVTASMFAMVVFAPTDVLSGNYCPVCQTYAGGVYIYSKTNVAVTIPSIAVFK